MFCSHCGTQISDGNVFCTNCGHKITSSVASPASTITLKLPKWDRPRPWAIASLIGCVLSLISLLLPLCTLFVKDDDVHYQSSPSMIDILRGTIKYTGTKYVTSALSKSQVADARFFLPCILSFLIILCLVFIKNNHDKALIASLGGFFGLIYTMENIVEFFVIYPKNKNLTAIPDLGIYLMFCGFLIISVSAIYGTVTQMKKSIDSGEKHEITPIYPQQVQK